VGTLPVRMPWHQNQSPDEVHAIAAGLASQLDIEISQDGPVT